MSSAWWTLIVVFGVPMIFITGGMIAGRIARNGGELDKEEMAIVRRAARVGGGELVGRTLGYGVLAALQVPPPPNLRAFRSHAPDRKAVGINPKKQDRAEGVIFSFHDLRITRTELIRGYEENAQRIPLRGLTATVTTGQTVYITIEGPETRFVYRKAFDADLNQARALQFAALLNYEASRQGAP
ncbi:hypothetical protein [Mycobacterium sp. E3198]|uniref:hypothetical protein n=1 Tax=Mycobacterium sp. E3198 TaxID=1834143 RepID=UPI0007FD379F|nr:hypothetical protein [Mycobacterium sp. E3198]OBG35797.1 hypothetical protein A5673_19575 [Mycobacterium sp. E3198]